MYRRSSYVVFYVLIAVFVILVVYFNDNAKDKATRILSFIPRASLLINESTDTTSTSCVTGRPCTYTDQVDFRVIVITFNRADSLSKLLRSLDTLVLDGDRAALEIWIDRHRTKGVDQRTLEVASAFKWKGGPTRVHVQVCFVTLVCQKLRL